MSAPSVDRIEGPGELIRQIDLCFAHQVDLRHVDDPLHEDLSSAARIGSTLFVSCDETAGIDRLVPDTGGSWRQDAHFNLSEYFDLPDGPDGEMDIEGLETDGQALWICGSHSLKRDKPDDGDSLAESLKVMEEIDRDPNRYFLGRVPLSEEEPGSGRWALVKRAGGEKARAIRLKKKSSRLLKWLRKDGILAPFLSIPSKENGIDIEGIAARDDRVWLGLRGPAIRGHAVILEMRFKVTKGGYLKARRIDGKRRYRKYLVPSLGLGIRDLLLDGSDLLILLGPTMSADGPARVLRWREAVRDTTSSMIREDRLEMACELPYRGQYDHPEGLCHWPEDGDGAFLLAYDAPAPERLKDGGQDVVADVIRFA